MQTGEADVPACQAGGLRHRRDGLRYRLWMADKAGEWRPTKRVTARRNHLDPHMQRIHRLRYELGQTSHMLWRPARRSGDLQAFLSAIMPLIDRYERQMKPSLPRRVFNLLHRKAIRVLRRN